MFKLDEKNSKTYNVLNVYVIDEQSLEVVELSHIKTGAHILLMISDDENRVFNIAFKTPVNDSKGTPHILEHSVLCGSRKYNVKDPFIELAKGSLNTFLNAMTFPDKTCYPVASANIKDFHNLMDVYLDAVFYPNAVKNDKLFMQEGWHYEIESVDAPLNVNGVVYNEMKGVYSDPDSILEYCVLENLYKNTNYSYESGGDPSDIINLTFDEFKSFHKKYYSASNSIIFFYGKLNYNEELYNLNENYLKNLDRIIVNVDFQDVKDFKKDNEQTDYYNLEIYDKNKTYVAYSFSLDYKKDTLKHIVMQIIDYVLFSSDSAILKDKFMSEGFGEAVFSHYEAGLKNGFYSIVSQNISEDKKDEFVKLVIDSIQNIIDEGLDENKFKAGINSLYFDYAEGEFGQLPRGIFLSLLSLDAYLYGENPITFIKFKEAFDLLREVDFTDKNNIFVSVMKEVFIDNNHRCINVLKPKKDYLIEKNNKEVEELKARKASMDDGAIKDIFFNTKALKDFQTKIDTAEDLKCIPLLDLSDIDRDKKLIDYSVKNINDTDIVVSLNNDKDIIYLGISFDISDFSAKELYLFSIINYIISKIDIESMTFSDLNNYIDINTGGLEVKVDAFESKALFTLNIKVDSQKISYAFDIFNRIFTETKFSDTERIKVLLSEAKSTSLVSVLSSGHIASSNRSKTDTEFSSFIMDKVSMTGIGFYKFIDSMCKNYEKHSELVNETLTLLFKKIYSKKQYFNICVNEKYLNNAIDGLKTFLNSTASFINGHKYTDKDHLLLNSNITKIEEFLPFDSFNKKVKKEAIITPNDINFCALSGRYDRGDYSGKMVVLRTLFNYEYLWTNIRVLGGAYGCMSSFSKTGNYSFMSYRDPHVSNTNKVFYGIRDFLKDFKISDSEMKKYIIGSIGIFDNPVSIVNNHKRNIAAYFNDIDDEEYARRRHEVLDMRADDFSKLADIFNSIDDSNLCALISMNNIEEVKKEYDLVWNLIEQ